MFSSRVFNRICGITSSLTQVKRAAGHSKWANIRHTKAAKDGEKAAISLRKLRDIKVALAASNWNTDVEKNPLLARAVNSAIMANVPKETVENFLKKAKSTKEHVIEYRLRGPSDSIFIFTYICSPMTEGELRNAVKKLIYKSSVFSATQGFQQAFEKKGVILAKPVGKEATMDDAEEAAILSGAEEVRPEDGEKNVYRYLTDAQEFYQVTKALREEGWEVTEAAIEDMPTYLVNVSEEDKEELTKEIEKFQDIPEFMKMTDNVA
ncbi:probable transcriptional regulatory protein TDE_1487 [Thrips palmi]|uniref:Probable transcriptional regulatory protein TDE_1487 n=1 Tax=Thrips palmi TaxID=161013 RepID=A0A6P9A555_THRPL|nr:probable transcriptional regulatory protein TDE_1487 [Thrips palmi]